MKIAYFSPLLPQKSGVSDYSEELLPELSRYADIDLYVSGFIPTSSSIKDNYELFPIERFTMDLYRDYDEIIYHIGNNTQYHKEIYLTALKYPGIIVLHDYSIHHLIAQLTVGQNDWHSYINEMKYNYGTEGEKLARLSAEGKNKVLWETEYTMKYPVNKRVIDRSKGVIVHSKLAENGVISTRSDVFVQYAPLFTSEIVNVDEMEKKNLRKKYNLPNDCVIFSSFGFVSRAKRIHLVLEAIKELKKKYRNIMYLIVGEEEKGVYEISQLIKKEGLHDCCQYIGFVNLDEFKEYIKISDVCINLRYPTQGETSASLLRILGYGKPAIVTNIGTFSEFPDSIVKKISFNNEIDECKDIVRTMQFFLDNPSEIKKMGQSALTYVKDRHSVSITAQRYIEAIENLQSSDTFTDEPRFYYSYLDKYCNTGRTILDGPEDYILHLSQKFASLI